MKIKIMTDSASDIPADNKEGVCVLPLTVRFQNTEYLDGVTLSHRAFYEKLIESDELPVTSQVNPYAFTEAIRKELDTADAIIILTVSGKLSGTFQSACIAAEEYGDRVRVVDTLSVAVGEHAMVSLAVKLVEKGLSLEEIERELEEKKKDLRIVALLDTLEYLRKGGRISSTVACIGGLLSVRPVVTCVDGAVELLGTARGSKKGNNYLANLIEESGGIDFSLPFYLGYSGISRDLLDKYIEDSKRLWEAHTDQLPVCTIGCAIGTHVGPGAIAVAFFHG